MRVLILNQYYHPDVAATAQLASDLGADLARRGHDVWALASARPYSGSGFRPLVEEANGVRIVRGPYTIADYACTVVGGELRAGDDALAVRWCDAAALAALPLVDGLAETLAAWDALPRS